MYSHVKLSKIKYIKYILKLAFIIVILLYINLYLLSPFNKKNKNIRDPQDIFYHRKTYIEAHRGMNREIFQNTIESFQKAIQYNIDSLETDVWLTKDKVLVLVHGGNYDSNIESLYGVPGNVTDYTYTELSTFRTVNDSLKMPTLKEAMKLTKNKIFLDLEIKDPRVDLVFPYIIKLIEKYDFFNQISLSSFHHDYYYKIMEYNKKYDKNLIFGFLYHVNESNYDFTKNGSYLGIYHKNITRRMCKKAHSNGMAILAWFGMFAKEKKFIYNKLFNYKVDAICSNEALKAQKFRDYYYKKRNYR